MMADRFADEIMTMIGMDLEPMSQKPIVLVMGDGRPHLDDVLLLLGDHRPPPLSIVFDSPPCPAYSRRPRPSLMAAAMLALTAPINITPPDLYGMPMGHRRTDYADLAIALPERERPSRRIKGRTSIPNRRERQEELAARTARYRRTR